MEKLSLKTLQARLDAQQAVTFKLFEMLLFMAPDRAGKALDYLDSYADEVAAEGGERSLAEAQELRSQLSVLKKAKAFRDSAVSMREALARIKSAPPPERETE